MKIQPLKIVVLAAVAATTFVVSAPRASAIDIGINVGGPPPPPPVVVERPWAPPYRGAVWIRPHNEWRDGRWVWVHGYYGYPPYPGAIWIEGHYGHGHWRSGHWSHR
jgi:hypothetical protein